MCYKQLSAIKVQESPERIRHIHIIHECLVKIKGIVQKIFYKLLE